MLRTGSATALAALLVLAAACGRGSGKAEAAGAVQGFLAAAQADDREGFERAIDRAALRADLRRQLTELARGNGLEVEGGPSDFALDRMIGPAAFHLVDAGTGAPLGRAPSEVQVAALLKTIDARHVCVHDATPAQACVLTFARQPAAKDAAGKARGEGWRLVQMPAQDLAIAVGPEPASEK